MGSSILQKQFKKAETASLESVSELICSSCGGNGYKKTSPDSYKTCLNCLGTGSSIR